MDQRGAGGEADYVANVVAAWALSVADRVIECVSEVAEHGPSAAAMLTTLRFSPGLAVDRLARTVGLTGPGAVQLLNRLEAAGWVERVAGEDRRRRHPHLTATGQEVVERVLSARRNVIDTAMAGMSAADRDHVGRAAERMLLQLSGTRATADRICRLCDEHACPDERCPPELALPPDQRQGSAHS